MAETPEQTAGRRFKINPVEIAIFGIVATILGNSIYQLFYDGQGIQTTALTPMHAKPTTEGRAPAAVSSSFASLEITCDGEAKLGTSAEKVRLMGPICVAKGTALGAAGIKLAKTQITNQSNQYVATVFTDVTLGKFSTDYIPLNSGANAIRIEYTLAGGKTVTQEVTVQRP